MIRLNKFLIITFIFASAAFAASKKITVGYFQLPPHSHYDLQGSHNGIAHEYFRLIAKEMNLENFEFKELPLPRLISDLAESKIEIGLYLAKNEERQNLFIFADKPLFILSPSLVIKKSKEKKSFLSEEDIQNLNICVWQEGYISPIIKSKKIQKIELTGLDIALRCLEMINLKRADAFYNPDLLSLKFKIKKLNLENSFDIKVLENSEVGLYTVFSKKFNKKMIKKYEEALSKVQSRIQYSKFYFQQLNMTN